MENIDTLIEYLIKDNPRYHVSEEPESFEDKFRIYRSLVNIRNPNPVDDDYVETFTFSDVPGGEYLVKTFFDGRQLTVPITVTNQATTFVLFQQTEPPPPPSTTATPTVEVATEVPQDEQLPAEGEQPPANGPPAGE